MGNCEAAGCPDQQAGHHRPLVRQTPARRSPPAPGSPDVGAPPRRTLAARPCGPAVGRLTSRGPRPPHAQCPHPRCCRRPPAPEKKPRKILRFNIFKLWIQHFRKASSKFRNTVSTFFLLMLNGLLAGF